MEYQQLLKIVDFEMAWVGLKFQVMQKPTPWKYCFTGRELLITNYPDLEKNGERKRWLQVFSYDYVVTVITREVNRLIANTSEKRYNGKMIVIGTISSYNNYR
ncbi:hypothetical protein KQX54_000244 [Cotesia glomerata]|uniref:Uncharacterized protein n=1 Tax=Cotesia glomerata TaxID=32391 RepID=A0AAV7HW43_COTGL|nr:hypothetical protein KQX54_000244 [Cotesia glomerata]